MGVAGITRSTRRDGDDLLDGTRGCAVGTLPFDAHHLVMEATDRRLHTEQRRSGKLAGCRHAFAEMRDDGPLAEGHHLQPLDIRHEQTRGDGTDIDCRKTMHTCAPYPDRGRSSATSVSLAMSRGNPIVPGNVPAPDSMPA